MQRENTKKLWRFTKKWVVLLIFIGYGGSVFAQKLAPKKTTAQLSPKVQLSKGQVFLTKIRRMHKILLKRLKKARTNQDLPATECFGEKLTNARALWFTAEKSYAKMQEAIAKADREQASFHYVTITQAEHKVRELELHSRSCRVVNGYVSGNGRKIRWTGPKIKGDPTIPPWKQPIIADRDIQTSAIF